jgi:hypothetical protein
MAKALATLIRYGAQHGKNRLTSINFDDNGLKDESFAEILSAVEELQDFSILNYNNN